MKKNEKISKGVLKAVERIVRNEAEKIKSEDIPFCIGITHQPKRPKRKAD